MNNNLIPMIIEKAKTMGWLHVFFINNPVSVIVARMIIEKYNIDKKRIKVFSFRNTDTSFINFSVSKVQPAKFDKYLEKLFWQSPSGSRIIREINRENFILYASWAYREVEKLLNERACNGHIYIEEGQHSYMRIGTFSNSKISLINRFKKNWKNRFNEIDEVGYYFREDSDAFIGIHNDVFPKISNDKKFILDNLNEIKNYYIPKLIGVKTIGITCAARRLKKEEWKKMLQILLNNMPNGAVVKIHPSFISLKSAYDEIISIFNEISNGKVNLCPNDVIIELEMLYESKKLVGSQTSLSTYADLFGSSFKYVNLY
ncbi:MAG: hypothetical protein VX573_01310 [Bacteroidota bacterium]|nr:hypothetical protein [Bacteroidota bacterium]